jgi:hypothetical protein
MLRHALPLLRALILVRSLSGKPNHCDGKAHKNGQYSWYSHDFHKVLVLNSYDLFITGMLRAYEESVKVLDSLRSLGSKASKKGESTDPSGVLSPLIVKHRCFLDQKTIWKRSPRASLSPTPWRFART